MVIKRRTMMEEGVVFRPERVVWNDENIFETTEPQRGSRADIEVMREDQVTLDNVYEKYNIPDLRITARDISDMDRREDNYDLIREQKIAEAQAAAQAATSPCR